ncbi:MAG: V-type ATP synthase subunit E family protein [Eubacteriales bacterium]|nr:V-type ATP synthase subunit E family protein [Eubacteriales bacterium]
MAGIDNIIQTIQADAQTDAAQAVEAAQQQAAHIRAQADAKIAAQREEALAQARTECEEIAKRARVSADLEKRKDTLAHKQQRIDTVFARVREELAALPQEEYDEMLYRLAVENAQGGEVLIPCQEGRGPSAELVQRVNEALEKAGRKPLSLSGEERPIFGGFILASGGVEINCSLDAVLRFYRGALAGEVAEMLFAKEA